MLILASQAANGSTDMSLIRHDILKTRDDHFTFSAYRGKDEDDDDENKFEQGSYEATFGKGQLNDLKPKDGLEEEFKNDGGFSQEERDNMAAFMAQ